MEFCYLLFLLGLFAAQLHAARILSIFVVPFASQYSFVEPLLKELARRGHNITSITNYPQTKKIPNFHDVVVEENTHLFNEFKNFTIDANYYAKADEIQNRAFQMCINVLNDAAVHHIMANETYDLIILDVCFSECFYGLSEYLQAPIVGVASYGAMLSVDELVGNITPLSYVPDIIFTIKEMNFWQRLLNVAMHCVEWLHYYYKYMPAQKKIYNTYFPNATLSFEEAQKNFALVLLNDHFSLTQARPYVPNMIEVAGLHIETQPAPLTGNLKQLLDHARQGVILVLLELDSNTTKIFVEEFKRMPYLIVWKTSQHMPQMPSNIVVGDNFNLPSIMLHPHIKLHVAAASFLNVVAGVYHGTPILTITATGQESDYVDYVKRIGSGLSLKLHTISRDSLAKTFQKLLKTNYYANKAHGLSLRFRDQQNTPMERAVYWIEYVLRHKGADHLKNRGQYLTWWQFYNVDVLAVIFLLIALVVVVALFILKLFIKVFLNLKACKGAPVKIKYT